MKAGRWSRRGFLGSAALALLPFAACRRAAKPESAVADGVYRWQGIGFGIDMSLEIHAVDQLAGQRLGAACEAEIAALEQAFSLYLEGSELARLNRERHLEDPSELFIDLLQHATDLQRRTCGFYQPAIQGAWQWLQQQGFRIGGEQAAWRERMAAASLEGLQRGVDGGLRLINPLTQLSMNAIGQGYLADRVALRLQQAGVKHALLHLGETRAIGTHPSGRNWRLAVMGTVVNGEADVVGEVELADAGLAVSANEATRVLIDPVNACLQQHDRVAAVVSAEGATVADAFATAFAVAPADRWPELAANLEAGAAATIRVWESNRLAYSSDDHS